jgi:AcrR family transcriptional regulator
MFENLYESVGENFMSEKQSYHHGGLKQELIEKGLQLLAKEGHEGFSMRKLAALCHVSHAAPYKHFQSKEEIVAAIAQMISGEFAQALSQALDEYPEAPRMQLIGMCREYVRFMVGHPDYFRFVFMTSHGRPIDIAMDDGQGRDPLAIAMGCAKRYFRPLYGEAWRNRFLGMWSMIQGVTLMVICQTVDLGMDYLALVQQLVAQYLVQP